MNYPDFFVISEAWRKAEAFARAAQREHLLSIYRASRTGSRRRRAAQLLLKLARRLDPSLRRDNGLPSPRRC